MVAQTKARKPKTPAVVLRDRIVELRRVPASELVPHPLNIHQHGDEQTSILSDIMSRIGFAGAELTVTLPDGRLMLIDGHARKDLAGDQMVPVLVTDLSREEADELLATYDPIQRLATYDQARAAELAALIEGRDAAAADLLRAVMEHDSGRELAALLQQRRDGGLGEGGEPREVDDPDGGGDDFDATPDDDGPTRSRLGDIWGLGRHRILCGDSTRREDVARLMAGERADMMWTDPPYGVSYVGKTKRALTIQNDGDGGLDALLGDAFTVADGVLADGAAIYIAHPPGALSVTFGVRFIGQGWRLHERLVWVKDSMVLGHSDYHLKHEDIIFGYKRGEGRRGRGGEGWYGDNAQTSVFEIPRPKRSEEHPTMKPVPLVAAMMANSCAVGGIVYEPFAGSGSTLIAAERLDMCCYAVELDPRYADVCLRRWEAETGQVAELLERAE